MARLLRLLLLVPLSTLMSLNAETIVYFGTYTRGESQGIYRATLDTETGELSQPELATKAVNPNFLAISPSGRHLYSVGNIKDATGGASGGVSAYRIDPSGDLELINTQPSLGAGPCYVSLSEAGRVVMVANYGGGSVTSYLIHDDGSISEPASSVQHEGASIHPQRQQGPHAHCILPGPHGGRAYAVDLGIDQVRIYEIDPLSGALLSNSPAAVSLKPGGGPRHLAFHPSGEYAYVNYELTSEVAALKYDQKTGDLTQFQTVSSLPRGTQAEGNTTAEIIVHPSGRFLYVSNRGHDSIAIYSIAPDSGALTFLEAEPTRGRTPRNFAIDPSGSFLLAANQNSHNVVVFRISPDTGLLQATGSEIELPSPVRVAFLER